MVTKASLLHGLAEKYRAHIVPPPISDDISANSSSSSTVATALAATLASTLCGVGRALLGAGAEEEELSTAAGAERLRLREEAAAPCPAAADVADDDGIPAASLASWSLTILATFLSHCMSTYASRGSSRAAPRPPLPGAPRVLWA